MNKILKQFKRFWIALFIISGFLLSLASHAQVNQALNFTGKVTETDGSELADGVYDFTFSLYPLATGGASIWSETLSAASSFSASIASGVAGANTIVYTYASASATSTLRVGQYLSNSSTGEAVLIADFDTAAGTITVVDTNLWSDATAINNRPFVEGGVIDVDLGVVNDFNGVDFDQTLYLEVVFDGETMRPRKTITSVAQAFNADTLDGFHSSDFANLSDNSVATGEWTFNNIVDIATSSSQTALTITQNGAGNIVEFKVGATTSFAVLNDGRVQIGDYYFPANYGSAGYVLKTDAVGDLYWDADIAGTGGGSGYWATSTDNSFVYQSDVGQLLVLGNNATSSPLLAQFEVDGFSWFDDLGISNQQSLRLYDSDSSNYVAIRATGTLATDYILTLPGDVGASGEALVTDGSGNLTWGSPSLTSSLNDISNVDTGTPSNGDLLFYNINSWDNIATSSLNINSDNIVEGSSNLFLIGNEISLTDLSAPNADNLNYNSSNGQFTLTAGYIIPLNASTTDWQTTYTLVDANNINWTSVYTQVTASSSEWTAAYNWDDHSTQNYFDLDNAALAVSEGGTGRDTWTQYAIPYMTDATTFGEIAIGSSTYVLSVNASGNGYEWIEASSTGVVLTQEQVDDYVDALLNDLSSSHERVSVNYDDVNDAMTFVVEDDLSLYSNATSSFFSTTTDTLEVDYGGTGKTAWTQYSIPYMTSTNAYGEIGIGTSTYVLAVNAGGTGYDWIEASSTGVVLTQEEVDGYVDALIRDSDSVHSRITIAYNDASSSMDFVVDADLANYDNSVAKFFSTSTDLNVDYGGTGQDSSGWTGFSYVDSGVWSASNTISAVRLDSIVMLEGEDISLLDNTTANYITLAQARGGINTNNAAGLTYASTTGALTISSGYAIPLFASTTEWSIAYGWGDHSLQNYFDLDNSVLAVGSGGTGSTTAAGARDAFDLGEIYDYAINSTATSGWVWMSDGSGRGEWIASTTLMAAASGDNVSKFIGTTTSTTNGLFATGTTQGYAAANEICDYEFSGSHFCRTYDILVTVEQDDITPWGTANADAWIAEGPPGFTANSNDCNGWNKDTIDYLGAFWVFNSDTGGYGKLVNCTQIKPIACCIR